MFDLPLSDIDGGEVSEVVSLRGREDDICDAVEVEGERPRAIIPQTVDMEEEGRHQHPLQEDDSLSSMLYPSPPSLPSAAASSDLHRSSPFLEVAACQAANQMEREEEGDVLNSDDDHHSTPTRDRRRKHLVQEEFISPPQTPPPWAENISSRGTLHPAEEDGDETKMTAENSSTPGNKIRHHDHTGAPMERITGRRMTSSASPERGEGDLQEHQEEDMKKRSPATRSYPQHGIHHHPSELQGEGAGEPAFLRPASGPWTRTLKEEGGQGKKPGEEGEEGDDLLHDEVLFVGENDGVNCEKQREEEERREGGLSPLERKEEDDICGRSSFYPDPTETLSSHPAGPVTSDPSSTSHAVGVPLSSASRHSHVFNGTRASPLLVSSSPSVSSHCHDTQSPLPVPSPPSADGASSSSSPSPSPPSTSAVLRDLGSPEGAAAVFTSPEREGDDLLGVARDAKPAPSPTPAASVSSRITHSDVNRLDDIDAYSDWSVVFRHPSAHTSVCPSPQIRRSFVNAGIPISFIKGGAAASRPWGVMSTGGGRGCSASSSVLGVNTQPCHPTSSFLSESSGAVCTPGKHALASSVYLSEAAVRAAAEADAVAHLLEKQREKQSRLSQKEGHLNHPSVFVQESTRKGPSGGWSVRNLFMKRDAMISPTILTDRRESSLVRERNVSPFSDARKEDKLLSCAPETLPEGEMREKSVQCLGGRDHGSNVEGAGNISFSHGIQSGREEVKIDSASAGSLLGEGGEENRKEETSDRLSKQADRCRRSTGLGHHTHEGQPPGGEGGMKGLIFESCCHAASRRSSRSSVSVQGPRTVLDGSSGAPPFDGDLFSKSPRRRTSPDGSFEVRKAEGDREKGDEEHKEKETKTTAPKPSRLSWLWGVGVTRSGSGDGTVENQKQMTETEESVSSVQGESKGGGRGAPLMTAEKDGGRASGGSVGDTSHERQEGEFEGEGEVLGSSVSTDRPSARAPGQSDAEPSHENRLNSLGRFFALRKPSTSPLFSSSTSPRRGEEGDGREGGDLGKVTNRARVIGANVEGETTTTITRRFSLRLTNPIGATGTFSRLDSDGRSGRGSHSVDCHVSTYGGSGGTRGRGKGEESTELERLMELEGEAIQRQREIQDALHREDLEAMLSNVQQVRTVFFSICISVTPSMTSPVEPFSVIVNAFFLLGRFLPLEVRSQSRRLLLILS